MPVGVDVGWADADAVGLGEKAGLGSTVGVAGDGPCGVSLLLPRVGVGSSVLAGIGSGNLTGVNVGTAGISGTGVDSLVGVEQRRFASPFWPSEQPVLLKGVGPVGRPLVCGAASPRIGATTGLTTSV